MLRKNMAINFNYNYPQVARDAGFKLRQFKDGPLDWRVMGSLEIERILRDQSIEQIDAALSHLSEAPLGSLLDTNILDSGIAKYFILSQFSIQYLLFCRKFLDETVRELRESYAESQMEVARLKKSLSEANNEILQLHKKITQIEAIHEVVYPCHLCTKSFVSNEALNIHIGRKHHDIGGAGGGRVVIMSERRTETPASIQKERDNDLSLINTIKLELEIKQLKERLNAAEKDIRERSSAANSKRASPREQPSILTVGREMKNIGIQSNLIESKEKDDATEVEDGTTASAERKQQLSSLQEKVQDFENWRETQKTNNEESIADINKKLADIAQTLENTKTLNEASQENSSASNAQRRMSPTVEDLERLLTKKIAEIGKTSAEKLEQAVYNMEMNYKEKLDELEREIQKTQNQQKLVEDKKTVAHILKAADSSDTDTNSETHKHLRVRRNITTNTKSKEKKPSTVRSSNVNVKNNNDTYDIINFNEAKLEDFGQQKPKKKNAAEERNIKRVPNTTELISMSTTESNHTFVKSNKEQAQVKGPLELIEAQNDTTDVSESLSDETPNNVVGTDTETESSAPDAKAKIQKHAVGKDHSKIEIKAKNEGNKIKKTQPVKLKQFTRKDAKNLANKQFLSHGLDMREKTVSFTTMKRVSAELSDQRNKIKQKYPHFYATRNKIKKFVDKLCSTKLPENANAMLESTKPQQPPEKSKITQYNFSSPTNSFETLEPEASTPLHELTASLNESDAFKKRLERILASPIRRPSVGSGVKPKMATAQVHTQPVPMPRKRVMFNTTETLSDGKLLSDDSGTADDTDDAQDPVEYKLSKIQEKRTLESSFGSLL